MNTPHVSAFPSSAIDLWLESVLTDPFPHYKTLRDAGSVVWLERQNVWAVTRHGAVREALFNAEVFSSSGGVGMNDAANAAARAATNSSIRAMLVTDDPEHRRLRRVFARPLAPAAINGLKDRLASLAAARVDEVLKLRRFDAVSMLAHYLPLNVVSELVGLSEDAKRSMLRWAAALFNVLGPEGYPLTIASGRVAGEVFAYVGAVRREDLDPHGWGAALFLAADQGEITHEEARIMLLDYIARALDTTINGLSSLLWLLGKNPEQWELLRSQNELVGGAIDEALRMEAPICSFARTLARDYTMDDVTMPKESRAVILYASANRDERRYADPDRFDITRDARDHVAFGFGTHICAGMHLAKAEIRAVMSALIERVKSFKIVEEKRELNNLLRGFSSLVIQVEPN